MEVPWFRKEMVHGVIAYSVAVPMYDTEISAMNLDLTTASTSRTSHRSQVVLWALVILPRLLAIQVM